MRDSYGTVEAAFPIVSTDCVVECDGRQHLRRADGSLQPLLHGSGLPVETFVEGWMPGLLFAGAAPFLILDFQNTDGIRATWLLDAGLCRLDDQVACLGPAQADALRQAVLPMLRRMAHDILREPMPIFSREAQAFRQLDAGFRESIAALAEADVLLAPRIALVEEMPERSPCDLPGAPVLVRAHLEAGLRMPFEDRILAATHDGMLSFPSPIDGRRLRCQGSLYLDDFRIAYRFADIGAGVTFYVIACDHYVRSLAVYLPALDLLVVTDDWSRHLLGVFFEPGVERRLFRHAMSHGPSLVRYLARGATRLASVMRGQPSTHLGHQLWNELSGIEHLLGAAPGAAMPEWIVPGPRNAIELWGTTDRLFPELAHRVNADFADGGEVLPYLYGQGVCAVRMTREHVSARLRRRLQRLARSDAAFAEARIQAAMSHGRDAAVIVLGLRVENRTMVDLAAFLAEAVAMIADRWPGSTVVIDGHNCWDAGGSGTGIAGRQPHGQAIQSHGEWMAERPPLQVERAIAECVREGAAGLDIRIVDTLGAPLTHSLAWTQLCDGFLSIWGASLAKYRWVCNKPGLVASSRINLLQRKDLHIYDLPRYMEQPTRLVFVEADAIEDDAAAPRLVPVNHDDPSFANFRADHGRVLAQFAVLVDELLATRRSRSGASMR